MAISDHPEMTCREARLLMIAVLANTPDVVREQWKAFEAHLLVCSTCAAEYAETVRLMRLAKQNWTFVGRGGAVTARPAPDRQPAWSRRATQLVPPESMTAEQGWEDLKRRSPSLAAACRRQSQKDRRRRLLWRIATATAAASILIAVGMGWTILQSRSSGRPAGQAIVASRTQKGIPADAYAELITSSGRNRLALGRPVKAGDEPQEVILGGRHRIVMNTGTVATFDAAPTQFEDHVANDKVAYDIQLAEGELYVEVVRGHRFTVRTDNALLTITGTKFDVFAEPGRTELILVQGSIRFSQTATPQQWVDVTAGRASSIVGLSAPSKPEEVDAFAAVAWARDLGLNNALTQTEANDSFLDMAHSTWIQPSSADLDSIDYGTWLERKRDWFAKEFPWIFRVEKALSDQHGIEADYVELLIVSGDIWQFNYPRPLGQPIPVFDATAIERIARHYRVESDGLLKAVQSSSLKSLVAGVDSATTGQSGACPTEAYVTALKDWHYAIVSSVGHPDGLPTDLLWFTIHAGTYLSNTRTAAYLWFKENPKKTKALLADKQYCCACLSLFQLEQPDAIKPLAESLAKQVAATHMAVDTVQKLLAAPQGGGCEGPVLRKWLSKCILTLTAEEVE